MEGMKQTERVKKVCCFVIFLLLCNSNMTTFGESSEGVKYLSNDTKHWDRYPVFSPDGKEIIFQTERDKNVEIYIMNADGTNPRRITFTEKDEMHAVFSPNGKQIAYSLYPLSDNQNSDIYIKTLNDATDILITKGEDIFGAIPQFSPDGKKLVFPRWSTNPQKVRSESDLRAEVYLVDLESQNEARLTSNLTDEWRPVFSPDGKQIAYISHIDGNYEIYVMNVDGSNKTRLTKNNSDEWDPMYSPDGKKMLFSSKREGNWDIFIMDKDGRNQKQLTDDPGDEWDPTFSPDGKNIVFAGERNKKHGIFIMDNPFPD